MLSITNTINSKVDKVCKGLGLFSYTEYDAIGRIIEVGQTKAYTGSYPGPKHMSDRVSRNYDSLLRWLTWGYRGQVTHTFYDAQAIKVPHLVQSNLRKRVASVAYYDTLSWSLTIESILDTDSYTYATHYSYDPQGNVQTVVQDIPALQSVYNRYKRIDYDYDLQSGKVNYVYYENDSLDAFTQWYQYDQDLRLSNVMTSLDQVQWDNDATYNYYNHGPLARMELGEWQVQGVDYAYTINGWMKGINSSTGLIKNDMGEDGNLYGAEQNGFVGADVFGEVIGYYNNDYRQIKATTQPFELAYAGSDFDGASAGLYNGNIRNATVSLRGKLYYGDTDVSMSPIGYAYQYDQLNRYVSMRAFNNYDTATNSWQSGGAALQDYAENVSYDGNGNILAYIRHGNPTVGYPTGPTAMDSMAYIYNTNNNQLNSVADGVSSSNYSNDIDNEVGDNYRYDKQGNMIFDSSQHLKITWNVRNKVASVYNDNTKLLITFGYDAMGNRIMKKDSNLSSHKCYTLWYEREAQGNVLGIYKERNDSLWWQEADIYGSSRVGVYYADSLIYPKGFQVNPNSTFTMELWEGKRQYELCSQLGNVLTTVSDKKIMLASDTLFTDGTARDEYRHITTYQPEVVSISDYYPGGMEEPGRNYHLTDDTLFRYGFNNKLDDNDIEGMGGWQDYGAREYLPRLGKFISVDPLAHRYPELSTYQFASDRPTQGIDLDGFEFVLPLPPQEIITIPEIPVTPGPIDIAPIPPTVIPTTPSSIQIPTPAADPILRADWSKVDLKDTKTWPEPPAPGKYTEGDPSRKKPSERGEKSLYDEKGGEWRPQLPDKYHPEGHWNYKPSGDNSEWQNVYDNNTLPTVTVTGQRPKPSEPSFLKKIWNNIKKGLDPPPKHNPNGYT